MFSYQKNFFNPTEMVDEAQFWALVKATKWEETIDRFRATGDQELKRGLPAFIFQATFDETNSSAGKTGRWRKQSATRLTGLVVMDVDHVEEPRAKFEAWQDTRQDGKGLNQRDYLKELGILLVYVTPSGHGLKVVFKARTEWGNLIDNQHEMARRLGVEVDESCKDASRMSFITKEEDILFIDKELFTYEDKTFAEKYEPEYRTGHSGATKADPVAGKDAAQGTGTGGMVDGEALELRWRGYDVQAIIDRRYGEKRPCAADSNRHNESLKLASDLLVLYDGDRRKVQAMVMAQPWVQEIIGERNENVAQTVASAAERMAEKEKRYLTQQPSKALQQAIQEVTGKTWQAITRGQEATAAVSEDDMERWLWDWGERIEALGEPFPLLKDVCKGLKRNQYPAALFVAGGLMMTLMTRCTYRFYHRPEELRRLNSSTLIIGDPASGKSFATRLFKLLAAPLVAADKTGIAAINRYKEDMKTKGANKEKPQKPKVLFRVHPARTSNAQFIQDMVNAVEVVDGEEMQLHMLTFDTELDNTMTVQKGGSWIDKQSMELKAFHNEEDGQAYSNLDSVVQNFFVTWNYIYTGTPMALKRKVNAQNFGSGLATRLTCIPLPSTNFEMMAREQTIDMQSDERLKTWAYRLDRTKGELPMQRIVDELYDWTARRMLDAKENDSRADEMLLKRCAYHGLNFAAPYIVMRHWEQMTKDGNYWCAAFETDETDWRLVELLTTIQYACQRHYFGALAEKYFDDKVRDAATNVQRRTKTIDGFNRLPETFVVEDMMRCFSIERAAVYTKLHRLMKDGLVEKIGEYVDNGTTKARYRKTGLIVV
ncbi:VirE N-terminal domain-containing protein [Prevotella aff. ruminicola Tc2-24]|uniref:VirE N-terminal domain-containing protein n=1 Tax=Prevotella aff. ruminicola Tc2-24 TaxID=81582 RepID=A0A1I0PG59_9BACT|nr:BT4734/BF3469 family protein [Prevotella aff. ruminicola Tc2-24]SEW13384.1 VirE N-terminal domain-containing protein [Prevotella aff. ruminicola Tc2-24]